MRHFPYQEFHTSWRENAREISNENETEFYHAADINSQQIMMFPHESN